MCYIFFCITQFSMKLTWSFFQTGESIPIENLRALKTLTPLKKKKLSLSGPSGSQETATASTATAATATEATTATATQEFVPERTSFVTPWSPLSEPYNLLASLSQDWNLDSLTLSGEVTEQKGGSLFYADFGEFRDRFSKVSALGFQHDDAFPLEPVTDGDTLSLRASGAFPILSTFTVPKVLDVRAFETHDSWKVAIVLSCLVHCFVRDLFQESEKYCTWLQSSFERVDPRQICVNKHLLSDAKDFATTLFQEFCLIIQ